MDEYDDIVAAAITPAPKLRKIVRGAEKLQGVQPELVDHWNNLQSEFDKAGVQPKIKSGFRTAERQNYLHTHGYPTKGNDGYKKISPHQEGRALDLSFSARQRETGRRIIADYAKRNNLHVPSDEPWHIAIPKQKAGQSDEDYADVVEAAMGTDGYDDVVAAAMPTPSSRFGAPRSKPQPPRGRRSAFEGVQAGVQGEMETRAPVSRIFEPKRPQLPVNPRKVEVRPGGFQFKPPSEKERLAELKIEVANELAPSNPSLFNQGAGRGNEIEAEAQRRLANERANAVATREGQSMGGRNSRTERIRDLIAPYTPGLQSLDTPAGIKTDAPRGAIRDLTLGLIDPEREITPEEKIINPDAERDRDFRAGVGGFAPGLVPYIGAGKLISKVPALNRAGRAAGAVRTGTMFGGVSAAREGIHSAKTGEPFNFKEVAISTAIGAAMGGIPGMSAGFKTRLAAAIAPQVAVDVASGTSLDQAIMNAGMNLAFETYGRKLGVSKKRFEQIRKEIAEGRATVPPELQEKLAQGDVNVPEKPETMQAQLDQRGFTLVPTGNPKPPLPRGTRTVKTDDGVVYYDPTRVDAATIRSTPTTELLGHVEPKSESTTAAVVARDPVTNTEIQSSAVSPENVAKQAEVTQAQFPEAVIETGGPEVAAEVIAERVAPQRPFNFLDDVPPAEKPEPHTPLSQEQMDYVTGQVQTARNQAELQTLITELKARIARIDQDREGLSWSDDADVPILRAYHQRRNQISDLIDAGLVAHRDLSIEKTGNNVQSIQSGLNRLDTLGADTAKTVQQIPPKRLTSNLESPLQTEAVTLPPQEYSHTIFGHVIKVEDQSGAKAGRTKVHEAGDPTKIHYPKTVDLMGRGNNLMVPLRNKGESAEQTAIPTAETAAESTTTAPTPRAIIEAAGGKYKGTAELMPRGTVGHQFDIGKDTLTIRGEVTPETVAAKLAEHAAKQTVKVESQVPSEQSVVESVAVPRTEFTHRYRDMLANYEALDQAGKTAFEDTLKRGSNLTVDKIRNEAAKEEQAHRQMERDEAEAAKLAQVEPAVPTAREAAGETAPTKPAPKVETAAKVAESPKAATPELQPHADAAAELRQRLENPELSAIARKALEWKIAKFDRLAEGQKDFRAGADPYDLIADIIIRGDEIYRKAKPKFDEWAKSIKAEFKDAKDKDLRDIYAQLSGDATSLKNKALAADREALNLPELSEAEHISWQKSLDTAKERKLDGDAADRVAQRVLDGKQKVLDVDESAGLELRIRDLQNQHQRLTEQAWTETDVAKLGVLRDEANAIKQKFDDLSDAAKQAGTGLARAFAFRRAAINENYDLVSMERDFKVQTGSEPKGKTKETIERLNKEIVELTKQVEAHKAKDAEVEASKAVKRIARDVARETREAQRGIKKGDLDAEADMLKGLIAQAWKKAGRRGDIAGMAAVDPEGELTKLVLKLARNRVKKGIVSGTGLVDDIHGLLQDVTDLDKRRVAEIISGYGRKSTPRSPLQKQLDALKSELYQGLSEADIATGKRTARAQGPRLSDAKKLPMQGPRLSDARRSGQPLQGPKLSDARKLPMQGPKLTDAPFVGPRLSDARKVPMQGPKLSDARRSGIPLQGPRLTDAPKYGPKDSWPIRQKQIEKQIAQLEIDIEQARKGIFAKKVVRGETVLTPEAQRLVDRLEAKKNEFQNLKRRNEPGAGWRNAAAIRKAWLLSWVKTHVRNIVGTGLYQPFDELSRPIAASVDAVVGLRFGGERTIQGLSPSAAIDSLINGAFRAGGREFMHVMRHGATREAMELHQFTEVNTGIKSIDAMHNAIFRFMSASDRVFWNQAYRRNLIDRTTTQARNEKRNDSSVDVKQRAKELESDPIIDADAKADAYVSTFNNNNTFSTAVKAFRATASTKLGPEKGALANFAIDMFLPFDRTPTNVIARVLEASPVGFYKAATKGYKNPLNPLAAARDIVNGSMTKAERREFAQAVGHAGLGSAMMILAYNLVPKGTLEVDEKENVFLNVRGQKINISLLSPIGQVFAIGARLAAKQAKGELTVGQAIKTGALRTLLDQPVLRATNQITESLRDPDRSLKKTAANLAFSAVPFSSAARGVGEMLDPADKRYPDKSFTEQFKRNIPIVRESLPSSRVRLLGSEVTKATREVERLKLNIKGATKQQDETDAEFEQRATVINPKVKAQLEAIVDHPDYDKKSDEDKAKWLKQAVGHVNKTTEFPDKPEKPEQAEFPMPTPKGVGFDSTYPADALAKYERMSAAQRATNRASMEQKARTLLGDPRLTDEQKAEFKKRLDALGITTRPRRSIRDLQASP